MDKTSFVSEDKGEREIDGGFYDDFSLYTIGYYNKINYISVELTKPQLKTIANAINEALKTMSDD